MVPFAHPNAISIGAAVFVGPTVVTNRHTNESMCVSTTGDKWGQFPSNPLQVITNPLRKFSTRGELVH